MNQATQDTHLEMLRRSLNSLGMGMAQAELRRATPTDNLGAALNLLRLSLSDADAPLADAWRTQLQRWEAALQPGLACDDALHTCCEVLSQNLMHAESLVAFDDWAAEEEAKLLAELAAPPVASTESHAPQQVIATAAVHTAVEATVAPSEAEVEESPAVESAPPPPSVTAESSSSIAVDATVEPDAVAEVSLATVGDSAPESPSVTPESAAAAEVPVMESQMPRVGRRGLSLKRPTDTETEIIADTATVDTTASLIIAEADTADSTDSVEPPELNTFSHEQGCTEFFSALPWHKALVVAPTMPSATAMAEHMHIGSGQAQQVSAAPDEHNPVLAATSQALAWAAAAPLSTSRKAVPRQSSAIFFSQLPWQQGNRP